jgi:rod shape-determining protein MreD
MRRAIPYTLLSLLFLVVQTTVIPFLGIRTIVPDILVVWIVYLAVRDGHIAGSTAGFLLGLGVDLLSGSDGMLGLSSLAKSVAGFAAGYFHNENKTQQTLGGTMLLVAVGVAALLHNMIYFLIFLQGSSLDVWAMVFQYGLPATLYTVAFALLPMFAFARKYLT